MSTQQITVYIDGKPETMGQAEAFTLVHAGQATLAPPADKIETASVTAPVETASEPDPPKAKKAPAKKRVKKG